MRNALLGALAGCALAGCALAAPLAVEAKAAQLDWSEAVAAFRVGEAQADMVYTRTTAARCVGRWMLHADAVDDGAFPMVAMRAFPQDLLLPDSIRAIEFFRMDVSDDRARRKASDRAESRLKRALAGNDRQLRRYFEDLGRCSTQPETIRDYPVVKDSDGANDGDAIEAPAQTGTRPDVG